MNTVRSAVFACFLLSVCSASASERPNIVIIMVDDLGFAGASIEPYGNRQYRTPGMDRLAKEGMRFGDFHSNGAACSPTRAALLTGRYQQRSGIEGVICPWDNHPEHNNGLSEKETTFAELFQKAGYKTGLVGKWHQGYAAEHPDYHPMNHGFDHFIGYVSGNIDYVSHWGDHLKHDWWHGREETKEEGYTTRLINKYALEFIEQHKDDPFCLYIAHESPHAPFQKPGDRAVRTAGKDGRGRATAGTLKQMVLEMDQGVEQVRAKLVELGIAKRTLVLFFSDNGGLRQSRTNSPRFRGTKGTVYEGGTRVPAIAWWPGKIKAGTQSDDLCMTFDVMPTVLSVAGIASPKKPFDGVDLSPVLFEQKPLPSRTLFWAHLKNNGLRAEAMRDGNWKLVVEHPDSRPGSFENEQIGLYNLSTDEGEKHDLAKEQPERAAKMLKRLKQWYEETTKDAPPREDGWLKRKQKRGTVRSPKKPRSRDQGTRQSEVNSSSVVRVAFRVNRQADDASGEVVESPKRPNVVLIVSDDHDNEHLGFMGNKTVQTSNLDRLAREGTVFRNCFLTSARCRPSLATLLSGQLPHQNGIYGNYHLSSNDGSGNHKIKNKLLSPHNSLPNMLKKAGYATFGGGKYWEGAPDAMGFTSHANMKSSSSHLVRKGQDQLFSFIDKNASKAPMFFWWAPKIPHRPHNPPKRFLEQFDPEKIPVPAYIKPEKREAFIKAERLSLAMEAWLDDGVGKLREKLKAVGEDENTLYVFLIDNGWCNGLPAKGSVFDKGIRTPAFFSWKGHVPAGKMRNDFISSVDIYPTILNYAGVEVPKTAHRQGLRKQIADETPTGREKVFGALYPSMASRSGRFPERDVYALYARTKKWKYVFYTRDVQGDLDERPFRIHHILTDPPLRHRGDQNLFNMEDDPYELNDLSANPEHRELMKQFKEEAFAWWKETGGKPIPLEETKATEESDSEPKRSSKKKGKTERPSKTTPGRSGKSQTKGDDATVSGVSWTSKKTSPPNLLFIAVDDLRPELACYDKPWMKTPNIDRLAASGIKFSRHYVQVATCGASRHALLTGMRPSVAVEYENWPFRKGKKKLAARATESFPHLFKQNGYQTILIGKVSHDAKDGRHDLPRSWSEARLLPRRRWGERHNFINAYALPEHQKRNGFRHKGPAFEAADGDDKSYPDAWLAEHAMDAMADAKEKGDPFLLAVGFFKPHLPFNAPKKYWDLYDPEKLPPIPASALPPGVKVELSSNRSRELLGQYHVPKGGLEDEAYVRKLRHSYYAAVSYVDAQVGKVLDELQRLELADNTIVVLWGDHGWHLGDLDMWGKHTAFEHAMHTPLIVRAPGVQASAASSQALIETVDIYPTLAELCNLTPPDDLEGDSFVNLLRNPNEAGPAEAISYHRPWNYTGKPPRPWAKTIRTNRYRFTRWTTDRDGGDLVQQELYDHQNDPQESRNIASQHPDVVEALTQRINED